MTNIPTLNADAIGKNLHNYAIYGRGHVIVCRVIARNRDQATRIAERAGYEVFAVNMEG